MATQSPQKKTIKPPVTNERSVLWGFATQQRLPNGYWVTRARWNRIILAVVGLAVLGYAGFATFAYGWYRFRRGYEDVGYWEMYAYPFKKQVIREQMGEWQIKKAFEHLRNREFREGLTYLRTGVARAPKNLDGRQLLSDFYLRFFQQPEDALNLLRDGLPYASENQPYINRYLTLLNKYMKDNEVLEYTSQELAKNPADPLIVKTLALHRAQALALMLRYDEVEALLEKYNLKNTQEGTLLMATILWTRDRRQDAINLIAQTLEKTPPAARSPMFNALTRYLRENGELVQARQVASQWMLNNSMQVQPRVEYLHLLNAEKDYDYEKRYANQTLAMFSNDQNALLLLANYATAKGHIDLVRRIYERAVENEFDISPFTLLLVEAYIAAGDFQGAIAFIEDIDNEKPAWLLRQEELFDSLKAVAYYGANNMEMSTMFLNKFLSARSLRVENLLAIADRMEKLGGLDQARRILANAYEKNPENQIVLTRLTSLDLRLGNSEGLSEHLLALMKMRRPSSRLMTESYRALSSDRFIFVKDREKLIDAVLATIERAQGTEKVHELTAEETEA